MRSTQPWRWVLLVGVLGACGGDALPGPEPLTREAAVAPCELLCERSATCWPENPSPTCVDDCVDEFTDPVFPLRADAVQAFAECAVDLACGESDDGCITTCVPTDAQLAYEPRCRAAITGCAAELDENLWADLVCDVTPAAVSDFGALCMAAAPLIEQLDACFDLACEPARDCVVAILGSDALGD